MKKEKIELTILVFMLTEAIFLLYGFKINLLNILIGSILGIVLILMFSKLKKNKFIQIIILLISLVLVINTLLQVSSFITDNLLKNYSNIFIIISFFLITFLLAKNNYHSFIRSIEISFYFFLIIKIFSFFLVLPNINFANFNHTLLAELKPSVHILYIGLMILYFHLLIYYLTSDQVHKKVYVIGMINPIIMKTVTIFVMGRTLAYLYDYPYMSVLKRIKYLDFIERMEGILSFEYLFCFFFLATFLLLMIKTLSINLFKKNKPVQN